MPLLEVVLSQPWLIGAYLAPQLTPPDAAGSLDSGVTELLHSVLKLTPRSQTQSQAQAQVPAGTSDSNLSSGNGSRVEGGREGKAGYHLQQLCHPYIDR